MNVSSPSLGLAHGVDHLAVERRLLLIGNLAGSDLASVTVVPGGGW